MKVAILGGTRFIGPAVVRQLVAQGREVEVYHRGKSNCALPEGVRHVHIDRDIPGQTAAALVQHRPDAVIDLCGYHPHHLEEVVRADLKLSRYVFCSSTAVYGQIFETLPDELTRTQPKSDYEIGKVACENLLLIAHAHRGFPAAIARLGHPYGPLEELMYSTGRDSLFIDRLRKGRPIIIPSAGDTRIQPIYVEDAAAAFVFMLDHPDCPGKCFNLAGEEVLPHDDYFASFARAIGVPLVAEHIPGEWFEANASRWSDLKRNFDFAAVWHRYECAFNVIALKSLGFKCKTCHDAGVAKTVKWLDERQLIPQSSDHDLEDDVLAAWKDSH